MPPDWLETDLIHSSFASRMGSAIERYRAFVAEGRNLPSPWEQLMSHIYLGDELFVSNLQASAEKDKDLREIPAAQRRQPAQPLESYAKKYQDRDQAIVMAYQSGGHNQKAIGDFFGLHYSRVSRIVAKQENAKRNGGGKKQTAAEFCGHRDTRLHLKHVG